MIEQLKNRINHLKDRALPISEKEKTVRYDICLSCEHFIQLTKQCEKCGCFMQAKTYLPFAECPVGKWGKLIRKPEDTN